MKSRKGPAKKTLPPPEKRGAIPKGNVDKNGKDGKGRKA